MKVKKIVKTAIVWVDDININYLTSEDYKLKSIKIRGSIMIVGPLLLIW